jgi:glycine/D-amino acid oxidase-like deaminating enzyme
MSKPPDWLADLEPARRHRNVRVRIKSLANQKNFAFRFSRGGRYQGGMDRRRRILIVGGGTAGWLTAAYLAKSLRIAEQAHLEITLLESPDVGIIGVGEATFPTIRTTLQFLGIDEARFIRETSATFKQGIRFNDWAWAPGKAASATSTSTRSRPRSRPTAPAWRPTGCCRTRPPARRSPRP